MINNYKSMDPVYISENFKSALEKGTTFTISLPLN